MNNPLLPGVAVVAAAGNEASGLFTQIQNFTQSATTLEFPFTVYHYADTTADVFLGAYVSKLLTINVSLITSSGDVLDFGVIADDCVRKSITLLTFENTTKVTDATVCLDSSSFNFNKISVYLASNDSKVFFSVLVGNFTVRLTASNLGSTQDLSVFAIVAPGSDSDSVVLVSLDESKGEWSINSPADSKDVIAVAAYITKDKWYPYHYDASYDANNDTQYSYCELDWDMTETDECLTTPYPDISGRLAEFSSRGPTRDGRNKPDIAAPGAAIVASIPSSLFDETDPYSADQSRAGWASGTYAVEQGTSMACPHVAGAVAVLFQKNASLNAMEVLELLKATATAATASELSENGMFAWGSGKVNLTAALQRVSLPSPSPSPSDSGSMDGGAGMSGVSALVMSVCLMLCVVLWL